MNSKSIALLAFLTCAFLIQAKPKEAVVANGIPWYDDRGNIVNAHGACIVEDGGRYYMFGEWKSDESNAYPGFACYSSDDLSHWKFENVVLKVQPDGILGPDRVGERVKVMKCPKTGQYVMLAHADDLDYNDPHVALATCSTIAGDYEFKGCIEYDGKPVKHWDIGTFQDSDGKGYLIAHHGPIYRLSDDYLSVEAKVAQVPDCGESPAMFKKDGMYYIIYSNLTSWEKNDNFYFTSTSIEGPWTKQGLVCPKGKLTYNSQSTFVLPLKIGGDTLHIYMGDRWSYPHQASAATYVWLPLEVEGTKISIPEYWQFWSANTGKPVDVLKGAKKLDLKSEFFSNDPGEVFSVPFTGKQVAVVGQSHPNGGYAEVSVLNDNQEVVYNSLVDFYGYYPETAVRIITPEMEKGNYTLQVKVTGDHPVWTDKTKIVYGSKDNYVNVTDVYVFNK